jgi:hypothetical protein
MVLGVDGRQLRRFTLERGDNSWQAISLPVSFNRGLHTINVWFLNNGIVGGVDRNAVIQSVALEEERQ